ncbi:MAG: HU family DNA-binding protein [Spirochaetaceae bacterium]|nr:MAG: HU family DNA-binding protein [Spirochaetaceae bacterium]
MEQFEQLPERIQRHLKSVAQQTGIGAAEEALPVVVENWLEKTHLFNEQIESLHMTREELFSHADPRGALLLTYSGSLIVLGPADLSSAAAKDPEYSPTRSFEYASIALRTDVPELTSADSVQLAGDLQKDSVAVFSSAPIKQSSEILFIASFLEGVKAADQIERLRQASIFLTNSFVHANRTLTTNPEAAPDRFTLRSIVQYVAARNDTTQAQTKSIIDDYLMTIETGLMIGERVSLGLLGTVELHVRPAQKARVGRNPATGEELLIPAKPEQAVPRFKAASRLRERASLVPVERIRPDSGK